MNQSKELVYVGRHHPSGDAAPGTPAVPPASSPATSLTLADALRLAEGRRRAPTLLQLVNRCQSSGAKEHVTVETVFVDRGHPFDIIHPRREFHVERIGSLRVLWLEDPHSEWFLACFPSGYERVYHLVSSIHSTDPRWKQAGRWINAARGVVRPFLNHTDFESIGTGLASYGDVEVGRVSARSALDGSSDSRGWKALEGQLRPTHTDVIQSMEHQGFSVRTLTLHVADALSVHLRRMAGATYYSGSFELFVSKVLDPLARAASERRSLLSGKERKRSDAVHPVSIRLNAEQLVGADSTGELIREVASLPKTTVAVFHRNPYLHLAVSDEVDGSNFDIMVTASNSIDIYPGFRATSGALSRLLDHLSDRFGGRSVAERSEHSYSLDELSLG